MKITIDNNTRYIEILEDCSLNELVLWLEELLPESKWREYNMRSIKEVGVNHIYQYPITPNECYSPNIWPYDQYKTSSSTGNNDK